MVIDTQGNRLVLSGGHMLRSQVTSRVLACLSLVRAWTGVPSSRSNLRPHAFVLRSPTPNSSTPSPPHSSPTLFTALRCRLQSPISSSMTHLPRMSALLPHCHQHSRLVALFTSTSPSHPYP